jgi:hypothetical protein
MSTSASRAARDHSFDDRQVSKAKGFWLWIALGAVALGLIGFLVAGLMGGIRFGTDPRVAEIRTMVQDMQTKFAEGPATEAQAKEMVAAMGAMRQKMEDLPPNLRREAMGGMGQMRGMQNGVKSYFAAKPEDRKKVLDKQIDQTEMMRKAFMSSGMMGGGPPGGGGGQGQAGGGTAHAGGPPGGPPRGGGEEGRNSWRKQMLDSTSPGQRAQFNEYFRVMEERRKERGMGSSPWGPRG